MAGLPTPADDAPMRLSVDLKQRRLTKLTQQAGSSDPLLRLSAASALDLPLPLLTALIGDSDPQVAAMAREQWLDRLAAPQPDTSTPARRSTRNTGFG
jgi:hypothetical protein